MGSAHLLRRQSRARARWLARATGALIAGAALAPVPAAAQQVDQAQTLAQIVEPATLHNDADMDFGLILPGVSAGTVVMTPSATPTCATTAGVVHSGACKAAVFSGTAFYTADLRVQRPNGDRIDLAGPGGATMRLQDFTFGSTGTTVSQGANGANHRFDVQALDGSFTFYVGGTLRVGATQAPGIYNGTYEIRVTYN